MFITHSKQCVMTPLMKWITLRLSQKHFNAARVERLNGALNNYFALQQLVTRRWNIVPLLLAFNSVTGVASPGLRKFLPRTGMRYLPVLQKTILRRVVFLSARYITLGLMSEVEWSSGGGGTGWIRHNLQELSATVLLSLSHLHRWCLLVSLTCRSAVLAYSNKCAAQVDDAAALPKINCLL